MAARTTTAGITNAPNETTNDEAPNSRGCTSNDERIAGRPVHLWSVGASWQPGAAAGLLTLSTAPDIATYGVTLSAPPVGVSPAVSAQAAARIATEAGLSGPPATVREEALASIDAVNSSIPQGDLVWAVSVMPPGGLATYLAGDGPPLSVHTYVTPTYAAGYYVVFIDAGTGANLGAIGEGRPASAGPVPNAGVRSPQVRR